MNKQNVTLKQYLKYNIPIIEGTKLTSKYWRDAYLMAVHTSGARDYK